VNGRELAIRLTASRREMRVLFMSGHPGTLVTDHGVRDVEASLLQKPFTKSTLLSRVRSVLDAESP
jgi:two-component system cell cycle sensor histidine kinase/response regulator CckA